MKSVLFSFLFLLLFPLWASADDFLVLEWSQPTAYTDGTPAEIAGTVIYWGTKPRSASLQSPPQETLQYAEPPTAQIVLDNGGAGTTPTGTWKVSAGPQPQGADSLYADPPDSDQPVPTYRWTPTFPADGLYKVEIWSPRYRLRTKPATHYEVVYADGVAVLDVEQHDTSKSPSWEDYGTYRFFKGTSGWVEAYADNGQAGADAVRFTLVSADKATHMGCDPTPYDQCEIIEDPAQNRYEFNLTSLPHGVYYTTVVVFDAKTELGLYSREIVIDHTPHAAAPHSQRLYTRTENP